jgi:hypothetical protein
MNSKVDKTNVAGSSDLFISFFNNPKDYAFLTKTIGCAPSTKQPKINSNRKNKS